MGAEPPTSPSLGGTGLLRTRTPRSRRVAARALSLGVACLSLAALLAWTPAVASGWNQGSAESTLWQLMNGARINNGVGPVQSHATLVGIARWRSSDMLARDYFSHTIPGCNCLVYAYYDSNGVAWEWAGENIGWNSGLSDAQSPVSVHEQFMNSPGHRANVLDPRFTHAGVGAAAADNQMFQGYVQNTRMYTELFLDPPSAPAPAPQPAPQPAPAPGGGGGGASGGGATTAPAAQPAAKAKPRPMSVRIDGLSRPHSSAGIDGVAEVVSRPSDARLGARRLSEQRAAARATTIEVARPVVAPLASAPSVASPNEVTTPDEPESGLLEGVVGGILAFLFG